MCHEFRFISVSIFLVTFNIIAFQAIRQYVDTDEHLTLIERISRASIIPPGGLDDLVVYSGDYNYNIDVKPTADNTEAENFEDPFSAYSTYYPDDSYNTHTGDRITAEKTIDGVEVLFIDIAVESPIKCNVKDDDTDTKTKGTPPTLCPLSTQNPVENVNTISQDTIAETLKTDIDVTLTDEERQTKENQLEFSPDLTKSRVKTNKIEQDNIYKRSPNIHDFMPMLNKTKTKGNATVSNSTIKPENPDARRFGKNHVRPGDTIREMLKKRAMMRTTTVKPSTMSPVSTNMPTEIHIKDSISAAQIWKVPRVIPPRMPPTTPNTDSETSHSFNNYYYFLIPVIIAIIALIIRACILCRRKRNAPEVMSDERRQQLYEEFVQRMELEAYVYY